MDATLGLALDMQHMNASLLPSSDSAHSPTCSHAGALPIADCATPRGHTELLTARAAHPHLLGLGLQYNRSPVAATSLQVLNSSHGEQLPERIEERLRDLLGEPLAAVDRTSVQLVPLRSCLPGEIVAVEDSRGLLRYGKVVGEEDPSSSGEVKVQVSKSCIRWYAVSQVYFFQSAGKGAAVWTGRLPAATVKSKESEVSAAESGASTCSVIAAVNALLARLNVSLSTSYEELLAEILRLQHRATLAEEDRRAALRQIERVIREKRDAEKAMVCVVCLLNTVDRVLIPCGHSYCEACVKRLHRGSCPVCRQEITDSTLFRIS